MKYLIYVVIFGIVIIISSCSQSRTPPIIDNIIETSINAQPNNLIINETTEIKVDVILKPYMKESNITVVLEIPPGLEFVSGDFKVKSQYPTQIFLVWNGIIFPGENKELLLILKAINAGKFKIREISEGEEIESGKKFSEVPYKEYIICTGDTLEGAKEICTETEVICDTPQCVEERSKMEIIKTE